jgi:L-glyceraldehyde 3-phosphate reductase
LDENLDALNSPSLSVEELARIDEHAVESGIDLWRGPATQ